MQNSHANLDAITISTQISTISETSISFITNNDKATQCSNNYQTSNQQYVEKGETEFNNRPIDRLMELQNQSGCDLHKRRSATSLFFDDGNAIPLNHMPMSDQLSPSNQSTSDVKSEDINCPKSFLGGNCNYVSDIPDPTTNDQHINNCFILEEKPLKL